MALRDVCLSPRCLSDLIVFDSHYVVTHSSSEDKPIVKLMGTGYAKRIIDEHKSNPFLKHFQEINPTSWSVNFRSCIELADGQGVAR